MDSLELLRKIKNKDTDAFDELMNRYGMSVYSRLLKQFGDRQAADDAFKRTMLEFYSFIEGLEGEDIIESMLFARADNIMQELVGESLNKLIIEIKDEMDGMDADAEEALKAIGEAEELVLLTDAPAAEPEIVSSDAIESVQLGNDAVPLILQKVQDAPPAPQKSTTAPQAPEAAAYDAPCENVETPARRGRKGRKIWKALITLVLLIITLGLAWGFAGLLMSRQLIPGIDLGYEWFNKNIYPLFAEISGFFNY